MKLSKKVSFQNLGVDHEPANNNNELMQTDNHQRHLPHLEDRALKRVYTIPRTATPVPPSGLNYTDLLPEDLDMMQSQEDRPMLGLANAPPLFQDTNLDMLDIGPNGEKRKATPPDLLTLSNMYFERNQKKLRTPDHHDQRDPRDRPVTSNPRVLDSAASIRSVPLMSTDNLGLLRPRKLTPLERLPRTSQVRIDQNKGLHRPLHLSVNYTGNGGWKQTLDPILQSRKEDRIQARKDTFIITQTSPTPSNETSVISTSSD